MKVDRKVEKVAQSSQYQSVSYQSAIGRFPDAAAVPTGTRQLLMLADTARAFNVGLGLNRLGGLVPGADVNHKNRNHNTLGQTEHQENE